MPSRNDREKLSAAAVLKGLRITFAQFFGSAVSLKPKSRVSVGTNGSTLRPKPVNSSGVAMAARSVRATPPSHALLCLRSALL